MPNSSSASVFFIAISRFSCLGALNISAIITIVIVVD